MVNKCSYCGEVKLCRFEEDINSIISNMGLFLGIDGGNLFVKIAIII